MEKIVIAFLFCFLAWNVSSAQYEKGNSLLNFNGGWMIVKSTDSETFSGGYNLGMNYEQYIINGHWSAGIGFSYMKFNNDFSVFTDKVSSVPFLFHGKFHFGDSREGKLYLTGSFGYHTTSREVDGPAGSGKVNDAGLAGGGGFGYGRYLNPKFQIRMAYKLLWLQNSYLDNGLTHNFFIGIG